MECFFLYGIISPVYVPALHVQTESIYVAISDVTMLTGEAMKLIDLAPLNIKPNLYRLPPNVKDSEAVWKLLCKHPGKNRLWGVVVVGIFQKEGRETELSYAHYLGWSEFSDRIAETPKIWRS